MQLAASFITPASRNNRTELSVLLQDRGRATDQDQRRWRWVHLRAARATPKTALLFAATGGRHCTCGEAQVANRCLAGLVARSRRRLTCARPGWRIHDRKAIELPLSVSGRSLITEGPCCFEPAFRDPSPGVEPTSTGQRRLRGLRQAQHLRPPPSLGRDARRLVHRIDVAGGEPTVLGTAAQSLEDGVDIVVRRQQALQSSHVNPPFEGLSRRLVQSIPGRQYLPPHPHEAALRG